MQGVIHSINISPKKGGKKQPVREAYINFEGIEGDGHSGKWHRQVSLLSLEDINAFNNGCKNNARKITVKPGDFAENITTRGLDIQGLKKGQKISIFPAGNKVKTDINESQIKNHIPGRLPDKNSSCVILEVTQVGKECPRPCSIFYQAGDCIMPKSGIFAKVVKEGKIRVGDIISTGN